MPIVAASIFNEDIRVLLKSNIKLWHSYIVVLLIVCVGFKKAQTLEYGKRNDVYKGMLIFTVGLLIFCLSKL